jgi:FtsZ-binding cell division protein ZapB
MDIVKHTRMELHESHKENNSLKKELELKTQIIQLQCSNNKLLEENMELKERFLKLFQVLEKHGIEYPGYIC